MNCEKHPDRESTENCAICGKSICEECLIEIAGNSYCKDCVNELVTESILKSNVENKAQEEPEPVEEEPTLEKPKFRSASNVSDILEEEGIVEEEPAVEEPIAVEHTSDFGGISTGEYIEDNTVTEEPPQFVDEPDEDLEAKYEKYLEDLYHDEPKNDTPEVTITGEYVEETPTENQTPDTNIGITGEYSYPQDEEEEEEDDIIIPAHAQKKDDDAGLSYEEIRAKILTEQDADSFTNDFEQQEKEYEREIRNQYTPQNNESGDESLYYADIINQRAIEPEKEEPKNNGDGFTKGEIALSIILIILIIIVMTYVIYLFTLSNDYPSYFDAVRVLFTNPAQLFENILH